jgi:hypothetical protein
VNTSNECFCYPAYSNKTCTGNWYSYPENTTAVPDPEDIHFIGDYVDASTSANDPIFSFHHALLDMFYFKFELLYLESAPYFHFPEDGYGLGGNLHDIVCGEFPYFTNVVPGLKDPVRVSDVLDMLDLLDAPYTYDVILDILGIEYDKN